MDEAGRRQVVIVDDAEMTRSILRLMLEIEGYTVIGEAGSAAQAMDAVAEFSSASAAGCADGGALHDLR